MSPVVTCSGGYNREPCNSVIKFPCVIKVIRVLFHQQKYNDKCISLLWSKQFDPAANLWAFFDNSFNESEFVIVIEFRNKKCRKMKNKPLGIEE